MKRLGANYVQGGLWRGFAVRDGNLVTGQQDFSGTPKPRSSSSGPWASRFTRRSRKGHAMSPLGSPTGHASSGIAAAPQPPTGRGDTAPGSPARRYGNHAPNCRRWWSRCLYINRPHCSALSRPKKP